MNDINEKKIHKVFRIHKAHVCKETEVVKISQNDSAEAQIVGSNSAFNRKVIDEKCKKLCI